MEPLDLTQHPPRSPRAKAGGLVFLPRTIDKLRAELPGGNPGEYGARTGMSMRLLERLGIDVDELSAAIAAAQTEDEVVQWVRSHSKVDEYDKINGEFENRSQSDIPPERRPIFEAKYSAELRAKHEKLIDLLEADDQELFSQK